MPSVNKTPNYNLSQWEGNEFIKREDLNADLLAIDTELKAKDTRVGPLTSLLTTVKTSIVNAINSLKGDLDTHKADLVTGVNGAHGLKVESGVFTPYVAGSTVAGTNTYSMQKGSYYKIGRKVFINAQITMTSKDAEMSGNVLLKGLPFNTISENISLCIGDAQGTTFASGFTFLSAWTNISEVRFKKLGASSPTYLSTADITNNFVVNISGEYLIN